MFFCISFILSHPVCQALENKTIDFKTLSQGGKTDFSSLKYFKSRKGTQLGYRNYPSSQETHGVLILIHGSAGHSSYFESLASRISATGKANVYTPDLRGHGFSPKRRGDIDYIGQLEDDLHDFISFIKKSKPHSKIVLGGHSSGGGFALRYAASQYKKDIDSLLLLAPYLGYDAPTTRENSGGWAKPSVGKIVLLKILNKMGITFFNDWKVIDFNFPEDKKNPSVTTSYTFRMNENFQSDDYKEDLSKVKKPLLVLVGRDDEAFIAEAYSPAIKEINPKATVKIIENCTHIELVTKCPIDKVIVHWFESQL